jgi:hypothetical protein
MHDALAIMWPSKRGYGPVDVGSGVAVKLSGVSGETGAGDVCGAAGTPELGDGAGAGVGSCPNAGACSIVAKATMATTKAIGGLALMVAEPSVRVTHPTCGIG